MPRYSYKCEECDCTIDVTHSMQERYSDCDACGSEGSLARIPSLFFSELVEHPEKKLKTGKIVREYIEQAKEEIRREKENLKGRDYEK